MGLRDEYQVQQMKTGFSDNVIGAVLSMVILATASCSSSSRQSPLTFRDEIDSIAVTWVPDIQEGIFDASLHSDGKTYALVGETDQPGAKDALTGLFKKRGIVF